MDDLLADLKKEIQDLQSALDHARYEIAIYDAIHSKKSVAECLKERGWFTLLERYKNEWQR